MSTCSGQSAAYCVHVGVSVCGCVWVGGGCVYDNWLVVAIVLQVLERTYPGEKSYGNESLLSIRSYTHIYNGTSNIVHHARDTITGG